MSLQLLHSEFPYICGKFYFLFYQCSRRLPPPLGWVGGKAEMSSWRPAHCIKSKLYLAKWKWILRSRPKLKMLVKFHGSYGSFPNPLNWWRIRFGCTALDQCYRKLICCTLMKRFSTYWPVQCLSLLNFSSKWKANLENFEDRQE